MQCILAICPVQLSAAPRLWPEPLHTLVARGHVSVYVAASLHEAAARVVSAEHTSDDEFVAILLDATHMAARDWLLLQSFQRHKPLPVWLLPTFSPTSPRFLDARRRGAVPWEDLIKTQWVASQGSTQQIPQGGKETLPTLPSPDKNPPPSPEKRAEIPVESRVVAGYDDPNQAPLLTPNERSALLGSNE